MEKIIALEKLLFYDGFGFSTSQQFKIRIYIVPIRL